MFAGKHATLGICVWGNNKLGETRIPAKPALVRVFIEEIQTEMLSKVKLTT